MKISAKAKMNKDNFYLIFANLLDYPNEEKLSLFGKFENIVGFHHNEKIPSLDDLEIEYTKLFVNAHPFVPAPPFASVYLNSENLYDEVESFYKSGGYAIEAREFPPDYLIYELVFLSNLLNDKKYKAERKFLSSHFLPWFVRFIEKVKKNDDTGFYSFICEKIGVFLNNRLKELKDGETDLQKRVF